MFSQELVFMVGENPNKPSADGMIKRIMDQVVSVTYGEAVEGVRRWIGQEIGTFGGLATCYAKNGFTPIAVEFMGRFRELSAIDRELVAGNTSPARGYLSKKVSLVIDERNPMPNTNKPVAELVVAMAARAVSWSLALRRGPDGEDGFKDRQRTPFK